MLNKTCLNGIIEIVRSSERFKKMYRTGFEHASKQKEEWKSMEGKQLMLERVGIGVGGKFLRTWGLKHTYTGYKYISEL